MKKLILVGLAGLFSAFCVFETPTEAGHRHRCGGGRHHHHRRCGGCYSYVQPACCGTYYNGGQAYGGQVYGGQMNGGYVDPNVGAGAAVNGAGVGAEAGANVGGTGAAAGANVGGRLP